MGHAKFGCDRASGLGGDADRSDVSVPQTVTDLYRDIDLKHMGRCRTG